MLTLAVPILRREALEGGCIWYGRTSTMADACSSMPLQYLGNIGFGPYSATDALDLDLELVAGASDSESVTVAGSCGGTFTAAKESSYEFSMAEEEGAYGEDYTEDMTLNAEFSDDYCQSLSYYGGPGMLAESAPQIGVSGHLEGEYSESYYEDYDGEDGFERDEYSVKKSGDLTFTVEDESLRYQFDFSETNTYFDDERSETPSYGEDYEEINNELFTFRGQTLERTYKSTYVYNETTETGDSEELIAFADSVFLVDYVAISRPDYNVFDLSEGGSVALSGVGYVYFEGDELTLCDDGSGFSAGTLMFGDYDDAYGTITFTGCDTAPTIEPYVAPVPVAE